MQKLRHVPILLLALLGLAVLGCQPAARGPLATLRPATLSPTDRTAQPTRSPSAAPGAAVVEKFVDLVTSGELSYRTDLKGSASGAADTLTVTGDMEVESDDYSLVVDWEFPGSSTYQVDVRRVGDKVWSRVTGTDWQEIKGFLDEDSNSPFAFVESEIDVDYVEEVEVDGEELHKVSIGTSKIVDPSYIPAVNLSAESTRRTTFEVLLDDDGRPVSGSWRLTGAGRVSGQLQEIVIRLELTFSDIGEAIRIREP